MQKERIIEIFWMFILQIVSASSISLFKWNHEFHNQWWLQILKLCPKQEIKEIKKAM